MTVNPYITKINTQILKKITSQGKFHFALQNSIDIDCKKYNCFEEPYKINGSPVEKTYNSSLGKVYITSKLAHSNMVDLSVDHQDRMKILRSFTSRYLIAVALKKHMRMNVKNFRTERISSSFFIEGLTDTEKIKETIIYLQRIVTNYIESGLEIKNSSNEDGNICQIDGLYRGPLICPHLSNLSEIIKFNIVHYELSTNGVAIHYTN